MVNLKGRGFKKFKNVFNNYEAFDSLVGSNLRKYFKDDKFYGNDSYFNLEQFYNIFYDNWSELILRKNTKYWCGQFAVELASYIPELFIKSQVLLSNNIAYLLDLKNLGNVNSSTITNMVENNGTNTSNSLNNINTDTNFNGNNNNNDTTNNAIVKTGTGDNNPLPNDNDFWNEKTFNKNINTQTSNNIENVKNNEILTSNNVNKNTQNINGLTLNVATEILQTAKNLSRAKLGVDLMELCNKFDNDKYWLLALDLYRYYELGEI